MISDSYKIREAREFVEKSYCERLDSSKLRTENFEALQLEAKVKKPILYRDLGYVKNPLEFSDSIEKEFDSPSKERRDISFKEGGNVYGGDCKVFGFNKDGEERMLVTIHYKCPDEDFFNKFIRGHEETHAVFYCFPALEDLEKEIKNQFNLKGYLSELSGEDVEVLAHIGGLRAVSLHGYLPKDIKNNISRFRCSNEDKLKLTKAFDILF
jgi:hypothetical protein